MSYNIDRAAEATSAALGVNITVERYNLTTSSQLSYRLLFSRGGKSYHVHDAMGREECRLMLRTMQGLQESGLLSPTPTTSGAA